MMAWPVSQSQPLDNRKVARLLSSSLVPTRPIGLTAFAREPGSDPGVRRLLMPSVGISPGPTAFRRMPYRAHSVASERVIVSTALFDIADGTTNGLPFSTHVTMIDITERIGSPGLQPRAIQRLPTACVT